MSLRAKSLTFGLVAATSLALLAFTIAGRTALRASAAGGSHDAFAYQVVTVHVSHGRVVRQTQWLAPGIGAYRYVDGPITVIFDGVRQETIDRTFHSKTVNSGRELTSQLRTAAAGLLPLQAFLGHERRLARTGLQIRPVLRNGRTRLDVLSASGARLYSVIVLKRITMARAQALRLFAVTSKPNNLQRQLAPGNAPSLGVHAYWFGPTARGLAASQAIEVQRRRTPEQIQAGSPSQADQTVYVAIYGQPPDGAVEGTPGPSEIQVMSTPVQSAYAQHFIAALNGTNGDLRYAPWPRATIHLPNGESAVVVPQLFDGAGPVRSGFSVITATTLVNVSGEFQLEQIRGLASLLRPI
jgi:hypothetical protein